MYLKYCFLLPYCRTFKEMNMSEKPLGALGRCLWLLLLQLHGIWVKIKKGKLEMKLSQGSFFRYKRMQNNNGGRLRKEERTTKGLVGTVPLQMHGEGGEEREDDDPWKQTNPPLLILWHVLIWSLLCCIKAKTVLCSLGSHCSCYRKGKK